MRPRWWSAVDTPVVVEKDYYWRFAFPDGDWVQGGACYVTGVPVGNQRKQAAYANPRGEKPEHSFDMPDYMPFPPEREPMAHLWFDVAYRYEGTPLAALVNTGHISKEDAILLLKECMGSNKCACERVASNSGPSSA